MSALPPQGIRLELLFESSHKFQSGWRAVADQNLPLGVFEAFSTQLCHLFQFIITSDSECSPDFFIFLLHKSL